MIQQDKIPQVTKDTDEKKVYGFDWTLDLEAGETVNSSVWTIETSEVGSPPTELVITPGSDSISSGTDTAVRVEAGTRGVTYHLRNDVTTTPSSDVGVRRIEIRITRK